MEWRNTIIIGAIALCCLGSFGVGVFMSGAVAQSTEQPNLDDGPDTKADSLKELDELDRRSNRLMIPDRSDTPEGQDSKTTPEVKSEKTDNNSISAVPRNGIPPKLLRREGQFLLNQKAYLNRSTGMTGWKLTFLPDASGLSDPPMYVMPCRLLEDMESMTANKKDFVFIVSGQVFVYKSQNYILPTAIRVVRDRGNLDTGN